MLTEPIINYSEGVGGQSVRRENAKKPHGVTKVAMIKIAPHPYDKGLKTEVLADIYYVLRRKNSWGAKRKADL